MSQDTRKDKRAKVVSLNVRYKSATVDEFIENHSHDVSKGGIFVKTPTPFPPGTLLKFEIRLAGDKSVISGVGRVVWKREPTQAGPEKPAGMGVKFIKIDDASRQVIDRLIAEKADAGAAYTSDPAALEGDAPAAGHPSTLRGLVAAAPVEPGPAPGPAPVNAPSPGGRSNAPAAVSRPPVTSPPKSPGVAGAVRGGAVSAPPAAPRPATSDAPRPVTTAGATGASAQGAARKATMMGIGLPGGGSNPPEKSATPPPAAAGPMFPTLDSGATNEPVREPTVMKQAAELLEEALKEAGGSLDEIGQNPLFVQQGGIEKEPVSVRVQSGDTLMMQSPDIKSASQTPATTKPPASPPGLADPPKATTAATSSSAAAAPSSAAAAPVQATAQPSAKSQVQEEKKGGGKGLVIGLLLLVAIVGGGGVFAWKKGYLAGVLGEGGGGPEPTGSKVVPPPPPPPMPPTGTAATATKDASAAVTPSPAPSETAAAADAAAPALGKDAGAAPTAHAPPKWAPRPPRTAATATATATETATAEPPPAPPPTATTPPAKTADDPWAPTPKPPPPQLPKDDPFN